MSKDKHKDHEKHHGKDKSKGHEKEEKKQAKEKPQAEQMGGFGDFSGEECVYIYTCMECDAEQIFTGAGFDEEPLCPECAKPMQAKSVEGKEKFHPKDQQIAGEWGGKGGFSGESGVNIFICPECTADKAFPGMQPGEQPQCPVCAIPMKAKYVEEE
jgi:hypothetical protein